MIYLREGVSFSSSTHSLPAGSEFPYEHTLASLCTFVPSCAGCVGE